MSIQVRRLDVFETDRHIFDLALLRIEVFKEFPYIYDGSESYEVKYLRKYLVSKKAALIAAFDGKKVVGMATCLPMINADEAIQKTFEKAGYNLQKIFYFGESVLEKQYRGQGIGKRFFDERERWAQINGATQTTFCTVQRSADHSLKPKDYKPLDDFWKTRGYLKQTRLKVEFGWKDIDQKTETKKEMVFWVRSGA